MKKWQICPQTLSVLESSDTALWRTVTLLRVATKIIIWQLRLSLRLYPHNKVNLTPQPRLLSFIDLCLPLSPETLSPETVQRHSVQRHSVQRHSVQLPGSPFGSPPCTQHGWSGDSWVLSMRNSSQDPSPTALSCGAGEGKQASPGHPHIALLGGISVSIAIFWVTSRGCQHYHGYNNDEEGASGQSN